jgi:hypothetical protein
MMQRYLFRRAMIIHVQYLLSRPLRCQRGKTIARASRNLGTFYDLGLHDVASNYLRNNERARQLAIIEFDPPSADVHYYREYFI